MTSTVLITGISGFIAKHCAVAFLQAGYRVRGTVRSQTKADEVRRALGAHADTGMLEFVQADLLSDEGWDAAARDCAAVAHLASPFPISQPKDANELIRPAVEGTLRVLKAARGNGVPRFVQTSSVAAIYAGHPFARERPFTEDDWSLVDSPATTAYEKSKTLAEKAARDFVGREAPAMHYASVNPGFVLGPALDADVGSSADVILMLLRGTYPAVPRVAFPVVDVRDIAAMHVRAVETSEPSGGRYMGVDKAMWFVEIAQALKARLGADAGKVPRRELPDWLVRMLALFDSNSAAIVPQLGRKMQFDNSRTRQALGVAFSPGEEAAEDLARSLIALKLV